MQGRQGEAVSIQLGQPYSEGIRSVIQPLPGTRALSAQRELEAGCLLTAWICLPPQTASSRALARMSQALGASTSMYRMRNIRLLPSQSSTRSLYSAMCSLPRGLIWCRPVHDVVFLKQSQFCSHQKDFSHRRWEVPTTVHTHSPVYI